MKKSLRRLSAAVLVTTGGLALATEGHAITTTTSFDVTMNVVSDCMLSTTPVFFGTVRPNTVATTTGSVVVTCTTGTPYQVALNNGTYSASCAGGRCMKHTTTNRYITYDLFRNAAMTQRWGATNATDVEGTAGATPASHTVYGRVPAQTLAGFASGGYVDGVLATVTF